jgi:hypothetical protein
MLTFLFALQVAAAAPVARDPAELNCVNENVGEPIRVLAGVNTYAIFTDVNSSPFSDGALKKVNDTIEACSQKLAWNEASKAAALQHTYADLSMAHMRKLYSKYKPSFQKMDDSFDKFGRSEIDGKEHAKNLSALMTAPNDAAADEHENESQEVILTYMTMLMSKLEEKTNFVTGKAPQNNEEIGE